MRIPEVPEFRSYKGKIRRRRHSIMKINGNFQKLAQFARRGLLLAALLAMVLSCVTAGRAQSNDTTASAQDVKSAAASAETHAATVKPAGAQKNSPVAEEAKPSAKGAQEGIKVHGHWTIEVRNADGSMDKRVEFENGLCLSSATGFGGGDAIIVTSLTGANVPGSWVVEFGTPTIPTGQSPIPLPCTHSSLPNAIYSLVQSQPGLQNSGYCQQTLTCFSGLSVQPMAFGNSFGVQLSGQFTVPSSAASSQITAVGTGLAVCPIGPVVAPSPTACLAGGSGTPIQFTGAYLTGTGSSPAPVSIGPNQVVFVTVQLSFH
jgi:hypothetical protein